MRGVMTRLHASGEFNVTVMGINYRGLPDLKYDFQVYPADYLGGDPSGIGGFSKLVKTHKPDVIWTVQDLWTITQYMAYKPVEIPAVTYFPVDTPNLKWSYGVSLGAVAKPVAYT